MGIEMAEIKRMNQVLSMAGDGYAVTAMERVIQQEKTRQRSRNFELLLRRYWVYAAALVVIFAILMQSITIYAMQRSLATVSTEIQQLTRTNETLRVTVLQARDLDQTKQEALASQYIARSSVTGLIVDLRADNFTGQTEAAAKVSWLGQLFALFE